MKVVEGRRCTSTALIMNGNWDRMIAAVLYGAAFATAWAQAPQPAILDIEWENAVVYINDVADPSKLVGSAAPVIPNIRNFMTFMAIGDIVSVNGKPAKGSMVDRGQLAQLVRNAAPGQAVADVALRGGMVDLYLEILQTDGTPVGSIMAAGFTGGGPPPGSPGQCCNLAVTGGTGAFQGARGPVTADLSTAFRATSSAEDPAN